VGKWNPDFDLEEHKVDREHESDASQVNTECCTRCNNRNVLRAAYTENSTLLSNCIFDKDNVTNLNAHWGPDLKETALMALLERGNLKMLESLLHP
jgi:hypothetical protein